MHFTRRPTEANEIEGEIDSANTMLSGVRIDATGQDDIEFAVALYNRLRLQPGNHVSSPLCVKFAILAAYAGAKGATADGIREALRLSEPANAHAAGAALACLYHDSGTQLTLANGLWHSLDVAPLPQFCDTLRGMGTEIAALEFQDSAAAAATVNRWIEQHTAGLIRELVGPGAFSHRTRLLLANAVYFKGKWCLAFDELLTREKPFFVSESRQVRVPFMRQTGAGGYLQGPECQSLTLRYLGGHLAMLMLLPNEDVALEVLESRLSARLVTEHLLAPFTTVDIAIPRFKLRWGTADLREALTELGMRQAFSAAADFSGIDERRPPDPQALRLEAVLHQACIEVNEEGTEAAAAAAITLGFGTSEPPPIPVFRADRPFLFMLCDLRTGAIFFMGRVIDPTVVPSRWRLGSTTDGTI